jgi:RNA polymerase sigma-70 factor, ECF subfamily
MDPSKLQFLSERNTWQIHKNGQWSLTMRSDEQLAREAQHDQDDCLRELIERHHALLFGFLYRLTGGKRALAEDLTQDAFLNAIQSLHQYQYPRPFKPWLYAIASNRARDYFKLADSRRTTDFLEEVWDDFPAGDRTEMPEERLLEQIEIQRLVAVMRRMPYLQREVLVLRYSQDLSLAVIAEILNIPLGTVKSRISLGLGHLRKLLKEA